MPRLTQINFVRLTSHPSVVINPATGSGVITASYIVGNYSVVNGSMKYQDLPQSTQVGNVSVPIGPSDTSVEMFAKLVATVMTDEGLDRTLGDQFVLPGSGALPNPYAINAVASVALSGTKNTSALASVLLV